MGNVLLQILTTLNIHNRMESQDIGLSLDFVFLSSFRSRSVLPGKLALIHHEDTLMTGQVYKDYRLILGSFSGFFIAQRHE